MILEARSAISGSPGLARLVARINASEVPLELIERADIGCVYCTASLDPEPYLGEIAVIAGPPPPTAPGRVTASGRRRAIWVTPRSWLLLCPLADEEELIEAFAGAFTEHTIHACRYSDQLCWLELVGADAENLLRAGSFLSLDGHGQAPGTVRRGQLAAVTVIIHRQGEICWLLGVERSNAHYLVDWLISSARQKLLIGGRQ